MTVICKNATRAEWFVVGERMDWWGERGGVRNFGRVCVLRPLQDPSLLD